MRILLWTLCLSLFAPPLAAQSAPEPPPTPAPSPAPAPPPADPKPQQVIPTVVQEIKAEDPVSRVTTALREGYQNLPFISVGSQAVGTKHTFNKNPILLPNPPRQTNLMSQYDGFRFRAPGYADVYFWIIVSKSMDRGLTWGIESVKALNFKPQLTFFNSVDLKAGTKIGDFVVPAEGARSIAQRVSAESLQQGEEYMIHIEMPCDGKTLNKAEYDGYIVVSSWRPIDHVNLMFQQLSGK